MRFGDVRSRRLEGGVLDEAPAIIAPVMLGDGVRHFESPGGAKLRLERIEVSEAGPATNIWMCVVGRGGDNPTLVVLPKRSRRCKPGSDESSIDGLSTPDSASARRYITMALKGFTAASQRSSMESFLDEYQYLRMGFSLLGMALIGVVSLTSGWTTHFVPILVVMAAVTAHSIWMLIRGIRSPAMMLVLDLTMWGAVMAFNYENPVVNPGSFAFLSILPVMFASSYLLMGALLVYLAGWYALAYFMGAGFNSTTVGLYLAVLITVAGVAGVVFRIRIWLSQLDANRSQMLGTVSHELRNNLTGMLGMTELVTTQDDIGPEEARELIGLAHEQAVDATEIVDDLLTISRLERDALSLETEPVDLHDEITRTAHRFNGEGTLVRVVLENDLPMIPADPLRVRQILRNLISNAVRYGGDNIEVVARTAPDGVQVLVRDDGEGVPPEDVHTIFMPYRRSTRRPRTGTSVGLGLWVSRHLAEAMGGALDHRRADGWTEFVLSLGGDGEAGRGGYEMSAEAAVETASAGGATLFGAVTH